MIDDASLVEKGLKLHQRGRLTEAAALYRQVLQRLPEHTEASHLLGLVEHQSDRREEEAAYERMWRLHLEGKPPETFEIEAT